MEDTAYRFQYRSYHMSHNHWNSKISAEKQQEYYEALLENAGSQPQATEEVPEPETEEAPDVLKALELKYRKRH